MMASISKRGKKWQYRVSYKDNDGTRKYVNKGGFPSKKAADIAAIEVERQHNRGAINKLKNRDTIMSNRRRGIF